MNNNTTSAWTDNVHNLAAYQLPPHCTPVSPALAWLSSFTNTCIPTELAFISVLLGTLSIISWLFAQLPQLYKNFQIKSTSGLSIFFLVEWCAGDISNLSGAILTGQASWQIIIGGYYTFVDSMLVLQWIWYEKLKHGRPVRLLWRRRRNNDYDDDSNITTTYQGIDARAQSEPHVRFDSDMQPGRIFNTGPLSPTKPKEIPRHRAREGIFAIPHYGSFQSIATRADDDAASIADSTMSPMAKPRDRHNDRRIRRLQRKDQLPSPSPRTVLFLATIVLALANASPVPSSPNHLLSQTHSHHPSEPSTLTSVLGPLLSWTSTALYLFSRLPQLLKNHSRRSTQGLSISLFIAAFFGNLFYSLSLLLNPLAWSSYPAHGCHGWAPHTGSVRIDWLSNAAPFFLGAAGVLALDGAVAAQFWWFARESRRESDALLAHNLAKASIVSVRVDSERTLVGSREGVQANTKLRSAPPSLMTPPLVPVLGVLASDEGGRIPEGAEPVLVVGKPVPLDDEEGKFRWSWKEVDGWMRGWKPSYSAVKGRFMRPKSRLGREVSSGSDGDDDQDVDVEGVGEDVMEGSETQALLGER